MKAHDNGARYQKTAHILSFTLLISSLAFSAQQVLRQGTHEVSDISPHDTILMLAFLYGALCFIVCLLINYATHAGKPRDLSFFVPLVIFAGICADTLVFYKNTGFFWIALFILYGIGALYNGFYKLLYFILVSQVTMLLFFETVHWRFVFFGHEQRFYWGMSVIAGIFYLSLIHIGVVKGRAARRGEYLSETLLTTTPNAIVLVDAMMCVIAMSNTFVRLFRIGDKNLTVGRPLVDLMPGDMKLLVMEICGNNGGYCEMIKELAIYKNIGYYRIICDKLSGNTPGLFINLVNITPIMKAKNEVEKASKAKNIFLAKMSHEIRTPLNAITGMSELILREETSSRVREYARGVQSAGTNLISIINDILDFSKIESGNMEISEARYEVEVLINDVINIIRMRLLDKPILFIANIDASIPASLIGDVMRVRQILINVLNNAVKYTASGFISFTVECERDGDDEHALLKIAVSDSGRGIKQVDFRRVFGEFVQLDLRHNIGIEGTGLGLAITKSLCKTMGGEINLESEYGKGSTFTVTLPQRIGNSQNLAEVKEPQKKRALLYEGRELYARSISTALEQLNVPHTVVANFSELSELLDKTGGGEWAFVFVVSLFYDSVRDLFQKKKLKTHIVVLADVNALIYDNARSIVMPAHSISIAAALNNSVPGKLNKEARKERWVAPDFEVLIVDDIQTNIVVAEGLMSPYKMQITGVLSGKEAISLVFERRFDLIFMDHMMPEMDGIETVMTLRTTPNGRNVPIIALTANAIHGVEEMFRQNGFDDILVKPIETNKLDALLEKWVPKRRQKRYIPYLANAATVVAKTAARAAAPGGGPPEAAGSDLVIQGIDTESGLKNTGGDEAFYIKVLQSYAAEGGDCLENINGAFNAADIKLLTTYIHGLKSSSANIGALDISDDALKLENAGKNNDWNVIKSAVPVFLRRFSALLDAINDSLEESAGRAAEKKSGEKKERAEAGKGPERGEEREGRRRSAFLKERLASFCDAAEAFDSDAMEKCLDALAGSIWNKETAAALEKIKSCVLLGEYEEAARLARRLNAGLSDG